MELWKGPLEGCHLYELLHHCKYNIHPPVIPPYHILLGDYYIHVYIYSMDSVWHDPSYFWPSECCQFCSSLNHGEYEDDEHYNDNSKFFRSNSQYCSLKLNLMLRFLAEVLYRGQLDFSKKSKRQAKF